MERQPGISLGLARVYLNATDPKLATRTGVCETRGSHRAVAGGLGKGLAGKSATQRATKVAAGGFPVAGGCRRAIQLTLGHAAIAVRETELRLAFPAQCVSSPRHESSAMSLQKWALFDFKRLYFNGAPRICRPATVSAFRQSTGHCYLSGKSILHLRYLSPAGLYHQRNRAPDFLHDESQRRWHGGNISEHLFEFENDLCGHHRHQERRAVD